MITADRGRKHVCPDCACKFYDMKAGTPIPVKLPRNRAHARKSISPALRR